MTHSIAEQVRMIPRVQPSASAPCWKWLRTSLKDLQSEAHARRGMVTSLIAAGKLEEATSHLALQHSLAEKMGDVQACMADSQDQRTNIVKD